MNVLKRIFRRGDPAKKDARRIYARVLQQSRTPEFYGANRFPDDYDGRIDVLTLHIAPILSNLNRFGVNGERLGQALFDEMKDDFEIALREEALSDASVKKRIQPMISLFYDRVKKYAEALNQENAEELLIEVFSKTLKDQANLAGSEGYGASMSTYLLDFEENLSELSIGQIAMTEFVFPTVPH